MKQQINFRASKLTAHQLEDLANWWGANQSETITVAIDRIHGIESEKRMETLINDILSGKIQPETNYPTTGETFFYKNTDTPLISIGRFPTETGRHVLQRPDGSLTTMGGYYLRRQNEHWEDIEI